MSNPWRWDFQTKKNPWAVREPLDVEPAAPAPQVNASLESMGMDDLRALAKQKGVQVHHRAGKDKIIDALRAGGAA